MRIVLDLRQSQTAFFMPWQNQILRIKIEKMPKQACQPIKNCAPLDKFIQIRSLSMRQKVT